MANHVRSFQCTNPTPAFPKFRKRHRIYGPSDPHAHYKYVREKGSRNAPALTIGNILLFAANNQSPARYQLMEADFQGTNGRIRVGKEEFHLSITLQHSQHLGGGQTLEFYVEEENLDFFRFEDISEDEIKEQEIEYLKAAGKKLPEWYLRRQHEQERKMAGKNNGADLRNQLGEPDTTFGEPCLIPPRATGRIKGPDKIPRKREPFVGRLIIGLRDSAPCIFSEAPLVCDNEEIKKVRLIVVEFLRERKKEALKSREFLTQITKTGIMKYANQELPSKYVRDYIVISLQESWKKSFKMSEKCECQHCGMKRQLRFMKLHRQRECPARNVVCMQCQRRVQSGMMKKHHEKDCAMYPVLCPNECKTRGVNRSNIDIHIKECPAVEADCRYKAVGCNVRITREELKIHYKVCAEYHLSLVESDHSSFKEYVVQEFKKLNTPETRGNEEMEGGSGNQNIDDMEVTE